MKMADPNSYLETENADERQGWLKINNNGQPGGTPAYSLVMPWPTASS
jgi:hypothetical protein